MQIRGACVMRGYHRHPAANAECIVGDGWVDSGDLGVLHRGRLVLTGRAKEVVIVCGANYYCHELEDAAAAHKKHDLYKKPNYKAILAEVEGWA